MAVKMKKPGKSPKRNASIATKERWIKRAKQIQSENSHRVAEQRKSDQLDKQIEALKASFRKY